ncbi:hypothetical protein [Microcoleus sp. herbarium2]|uniref:hypothetical protein n=1 Tax=Microcoleus sp. herbarium2 TaxID=3055433 RepID=UPI002FCE811E
MPPAVGAPAQPAELPNIPVNSNYRRSRLADSTAGPLNEQRMRSAMQLLQSEPRSRKYFSGTANGLSCRF